MDAAQAVEDRYKLPSRSGSKSSGPVRFKEVAKKVGVNKRDTVAVQKANAVSAPSSIGPPSRRHSFTSSAGMTSLAQNGSLVVPTFQREHRMSNRLQYLENEKLALDSELNELKRALSDSQLDQRRAQLMVGKHQSKVAATEKKSHVMQLQINSLRNHLHGRTDESMRRPTSSSDGRHASVSSSELFAEGSSAMSMDVPSVSSSSRPPRHEGDVIMQGNAVGCLDTGNEARRSADSDGARKSCTAGRNARLGLDIPSVDIFASGADCSPRSRGRSDGLNSGRVSPTVFQNASVPGSRGVQMEEEIADTEDPDVLDEEMLQEWFLMVEEDLHTRYGEHHSHAVGRIVDSEVEYKVRARLDEVQDRHREAIRQWLIEGGGTEIRAFKAMDYNASGKICLGDFSGGVERLGVPWQEIMGTSNPKHLFKLFDTRRKGSLTFKDLFPDASPYVEKDLGDSTPDLYRRWCRRQDRDPASMNRKARWLPENVEELAALARQQQDKLDDVAEAKKRMESMIKRLKTRGKSHARCREIAARHLPPGTGPEDFQGVKTFSKAEVTASQKRYTERVFETSRDVQKVLYDMRHQAKELKKANHALYAVTEEPYQRLKMVEEQKAQVSALAGVLGGKLKDSKEAGG